VSLAFDEHVVLDKVSFIVPKGRMTIVLGASGSGKSVALKLILGLIRPDAGQILVHGQRVDRMSEQELLRARGDVGMLFQETALFDSLTVAENVGYRLSEELRLPEEEVGTRVQDVLGFVGLAEYGERGTTELSGGQRRRVAIARAMAAQPSLLMNNWGANNLNVTNISVNNNTPIWVCLYGPGIPGQSPMTLKTDGTPLGLATGQSAMATASPQFMRLALSGTSPKLCIFAIIGGPPDPTGNNGYVIAVNAASNTGPGTGLPPPAGYYATTSSNIYPFQFNWGSSKIYVVNMSPATSSSAQVTLSPL